jgi:hypothetical protein
MRSLAPTFALAVLASCGATPPRPQTATTPATKTHASGQIEVKTYEPTAYDTAAPKLNELHVTESFTGDITGDGAARMLQAQRADGSASFVAIERVTGTIGGKRGTFLLQDAGTLTGNKVAGTWFVVPRSGTEELANLRGEGTFDATLGQHASYTLDYWFE